MTVHYITANLNTEREGTDEEFDALTDRLVLELDRLGCVDVDLTCSLRDRHVTVVMGVDAAGEQEALDLGTRHLCAAWRTAGGTDAHVYAWPGTDNPWAVDGSVQVDLSPEGMG